MSWENDKELESGSGKFVRFVEGPNKITIQSDGEKVRNQFGNPCVEFKTSDEKILSIRPGPILDALREAKAEHGTLVGRVLHVVREGLSKDDTRYTDVKVE